MNDIFILMWLGDVVRSIDTYLGLAVGTYVIASITTLFFGMCYAGYSIEHDDDESKQTAKFICKTWVRSLWFGVPLFLLSSALPTKDTIRLGIAMKAGSVIANTPLGQKAGDAANAILDRIIKEAGGVPAKSEEKK